VLEITAPVKESALPKQIEIKTGEKEKEKAKRPLSSWAALSFSQFAVDSSKAGRSGT